MSTYQEILAQQYEESARDLLIHPTQNTDELENLQDVDPHNLSNQVGTTLDNPEDFQKFGGNRGDQDHLLVIKPFVDIGKTSVRYYKDVQTNIFSIDSRFRAYATAGIPLPPSVLNNYRNTINAPLMAALSQTTLVSLSSNFVFRLQKLSKNTMSAKLTSFELPNTFYNIQDIRNNNYILLAAGTCASNPQYIPVPVLTIDTSLSAKTCSDYTQGAVGQPNGFYYTNTTIVPALNTALASTQIPDAIISSIIGDGTISTITVTSTASLKKDDSITFKNTPFYDTYTISSILNSTQFTILSDYNDTFTQTTINIPTVSGPARFFSQDLSVSYSNGYCIINNNSQNTYTVNFSPDTTTFTSFLFSTLGSMLGFNNYTYDINPLNESTSTSYNIECAQISACQCYGNLIGENMINVNADPYIYLSISDWANIQHATVNDTYFTAFVRIPINIPKGELIYDTLVNNTSTKIYYFTQPTNIQQFEIKLLDMTGQKLIMPTTNWSMILELEEVLSQSLYEKLREL